MRTSDDQEKRKAEILSLLQSGTPVEVNELAKRFKVTPTTIRTNLNDLVAQKKVIRMLGRVVISEPAQRSPLAKRLQIDWDKKKAIGRAAAALVKDNDIIALDASSTTLAMAPHLRQRKNLTVVTNCLAIADEFLSYPQVEVVMLGGRLFHDASSVVGPETIEFLKRLHFQTAFVGTAGIGFETGLTDRNPATIEFKKALISIANRVVIVSDSGKWEKASLTRFAELSEVDVLVTDKSIGEARIRKLKQLGVDVVTA